jgi:hypothetical protein
VPARLPRPREWPGCVPPRPAAHPGPPRADRFPMAASRRRSGSHRGLGRRVPGRPGAGGALRSRSSRWRCPRPHRRPSRRPIGRSVPRRLRPRGPRSLARSSSLPSCVCEGRRRLPKGVCEASGPEGRALTPSARSHLMCARARGSDPRAPAALRRARGGPVLGGHFGRDSPGRARGRRGRRLALVPHPRSRGPDGRARAGKFASRVAAVTTKGGKSSEPVRRD